MDKNTAKNTIQNAGMSTYDIANSIYLATVEGISGANQNEGYGFALSAIAELWNIRGTMGNPFGKTKITGRYKGMAVTQKMIMDVVSRYPQGFDADTPLFDDLLDFATGSEKPVPPPKQNWNVHYSELDFGKDAGTPVPSPKQKVVTDVGEPQLSDKDYERMAKVMGISFVVILVLCKFIFHFGWILSIVLGFLGTMAVELLLCYLIYYSRKE